MLANIFIEKSFLGTKRIYDYDPNYTLNRFTLYLNQRLLKNIIYVEPITLDLIGDSYDILDITNNIYLKFKAFSEDYNENDNLNLASSSDKFVELVITYNKNLNILNVFCNESLENLSASSIEFISEIIDNLRVLGKIPAEYCDDDECEDRDEVDNSSDNVEMGSDDETSSENDESGSTPELIKEEIIYDNSTEDTKEEEVEVVESAKPIDERKARVMEELRLKQQKQSEQLEQPEQEEQLEQEEQVEQEEQPEIIPEEIPAEVEAEPSYHVEGDELVVDNIVDENDFEPEQEPIIETTPSEVEVEEPVEEDAGFQEEMPKDEVEATEGEYVNNFIADMVDDVEGFGSKVIKIWQNGKDDVLNNNLYFTPIIENNQQAFLVEDIDNNEFTKISLNDDNSLELSMITKDEFAKLYQLRKDQ